MQPYQPLYGQSDPMPNWINRPAAVTSRRTPTNAESWRKMRDELAGSVRRLPTGTRFVLRPTAESGVYDLLRTSDLVWGPSQSEYQLRHGRVYYQGKMTVWTLADLRPTGAAPIPSLAAGA